MRNFKLGKKTVFFLRLPIKCRMMGMETAERPKSNQGVRKERPTKNSLF